MNYGTPINTESFTIIAFKGECSDCFRTSMKPMLREMVSKDGVVQFYCMTCGVYFKVQFALTRQDAHPEEYAQYPPV